VAITPSGLIKTLVVRDESYLTPLIKPAAGFFFPFYQRTVGSRLSSRRSSPFLFENDALEKQQLDMYGFSGTLTGLSSLPSKYLPLREKSPRLRASACSWGGRNDESSYLWGLVIFPSRQKPPLPFFPLGNELIFTPLKMTTETPLPFSGRLTACPSALIPHTVTPSFFFFFFFFFFFLFFFFFFFFFFFPLPFSVVPAPPSSWTEAADAKNL